MDWTLRRMGELREETLATASGDVLEVGFGTGLNLRHYPSAVRSLVALDPLDALRERVEARIAAAAFPVERAHLRAGGSLPFPSGHFDCVVTTWTLCSIDDAVAALGEMRRVLRPGGRYLFIEHGRSGEESIARWQTRLDPLQRRIGCGCHLDRPIDALVRKGGFTLESVERFVPEGRPRAAAVFETLYRGVATP
jgi:SAM-dependent methyltransferase